MSDIRDILEIEQTSFIPTKEAIVGGTKKKTKKLTETSFKRPEGMHRELYALLYSDSRDPPPLAPSDSSQGYKQLKAKIGRSRVRPWKFMAFTNPARTDGLILNHWRREADEGKEYPFAKFNKKVNIPLYTDEEYKMHLEDATETPWTREETDHLFDLCRRFDQRFLVVHDRYDRETYKARSIEELKERYYNCVAKIIKARTPPGQEPKNLPPAFDAQHETNRKNQLLKLFNRTTEQVKEEELLVAELKKIEMRKREREKKQQDLQKLITAAENSASTEFRMKHTPSIYGHSANKKEKKLPKKKQTKKKSGEPTGGKQNEPAAPVKFPEVKGAGVYLRSQKMKLPVSIGTKKTKAVELLLEELGVDLQPMPTEAICQSFNDLRTDMILLYELKQAASNCEFELQSLRHRFEAVCPGKDLPTLSGDFSVLPKAGTSESTTPLIDVVTPSPGTPSARKRRTVAPFLDPVAIKKKKI